MRSSDDLYLPHLLMVVAGLGSVLRLTSVFPRRMPSTGVGTLSAGPCPSPSFLNDKPSLGQSRIDTWNSKHTSFFRI